MDVKAKDRQTPSQGGLPGPVVHPADNHKHAKCIGVYVEANGLLLVQSKGQVITASRRVPVDPEVMSEGALFSAALASVLKEFAPHGKRHPIWATAFFPSLSVAHIRVPKLSGSELSSAIYWTAKKEIGLNGPESVLWDYRSDGEVNEDGVKKLCATVYAVSTEEVRFIEQVFYDAGYPLTGLTAPFFAYQNLFHSGWKFPPGEGALFLHIGYEASQIMIVSETGILLSREINTGLQTFINAVHHRCGRSVSEQELMDMISDAHTSEEDRNESLEENMGPDSDRAELYQLLKPAFRRLVRQIERTLLADVVARSGLNVRQVYISGALCSSASLLDYLASQTGLEGHAFKAEEYLDDSRVEMIDENSAGDLHYMPALGLALSDSDSTPNLLYPYVEKEKKARSNRISLMLLSGFFILLLALLGAQMLLDNMVDAQGRRLVELQEKVKAEGVLLTEPMLLNAVDDLRSTLSHARASLVEDFPLVIVRELIRIPAEAVFLTRMDLTMDTLHTKGSGQGLSGRTPHSLRLEGQVVGAEAQLEALLADYVVKLEGAPLFHHVHVTTRDRLTDLNPVALAFTLTVEFDPPLPAEQAAVAQGGDGA